MPYLYGRSGTSRGSSSGGAFSPLSIPNLLLWWDATGSLYTTNSEITPVTDGSPVARIRDKSGNGLHANQEGADGTRGTFRAVSLYAPTGKPGVVFTSASGSYLTTSYPQSAFAAYCPMTLFHVGTQEAVLATTNSAVGWANRASGSPSFYSYLGIQDTVWGSRRNHLACANTWLANGMDINSTTGIQLYQLRYDDNGWYYRRNQLTPTTGAKSSAYPTPNELDSVTWGAIRRSSGVIAPGSVENNETLIYSRYLSDAEANQIIAYLRTKWGTP